MPETAEKNYNMLKEYAFGNGASLFGVCEMDYSKIETTDILPGTLGGLDYGISLGAILSNRIVEGIIDHPTKLYFYHYRQVNSLLDKLALCLTALIQGKGFEALPIPSSQIVDWTKQKGHISHKEVARLSGLGWIGRNNLLVNPRFGSRLRLVTVLTDMPLSVEKPLKEDCGDCKICISACPAGAIKDEKEKFDHKKCYQQLDDFRKKHGISHHICGICVKACSGAEARSEEARKRGSEEVIRQR